jgi:hypothetical protein
MLAWRTWALLVVASLLLLGSRALWAQDEDPEAKERKAKLAEEFSDPLTTLPQIFVQDAYTPENYNTRAETNRVIARVIVPRLPQYSLFPLVQLIRPSFSVVTVPAPNLENPKHPFAGNRTVTAFGDVQLFDLAVVPWPARETGLMMGIGPIFVFPTASDTAAGQNAWQVGPAFGAIYKGIPGILLGGLIQNPISFAYNDPSAKSLNTLLVQPIVVAYLGKGFYVKTADATWTMNWRHNTPTTLPVSAGLGYILLREGTPPINLFVTGEWMAYRQFTQGVPVAQTTVRFGVTVAFPDWQPWH